MLRAYFSWMKRFTVSLFVLCFFFLSSSVPLFAHSGCCSHHNGVCGCGCCDGSPLSAICAPYYPSCSNTNTAPADSGSDSTTTNTYTAPVYSSPTNTPIPLVPTHTPTPSPTWTQTPTLKATPTVTPLPPTNTPTATPQVPTAAVLGASTIHGNLLLTYLFIIIGSYTLVGGFLLGIKMIKKHRKKHEE